MSKKTNPKSKAVKKVVPVEFGSNNSNIAKAQEILTALPAQEKRKPLAQALQCIVTAAWNGPKPTEPPSPAAPVPTSTEQAAQAS